MEAYNGYLKPYVPIIAAMSLAGQRPKQIAELLEELGAHPHRGRTEYSLGGLRRYRVQQMTGLLANLLHAWPIKTGRIKCPESHEWTPESNWHEAQAVRAEG